ncbi:hypothetical protein ADIAL_1844 [Alkalibacterium sp. AK22]|nr:hypothetical protein ADIAL_1844 [Alkalibacterium sp. AK22]
MKPNRKAGRFEWILESAGFFYIKRELLTFKMNAAAPLLFLTYLQSQLTG